MGGRKTTRREPTRRHLVICQSTDGPPLLVGSSDTLVEALDVILRVREDLRREERELASNSRFVIYDSECRIGYDDCGIVTSPMM